MLATAKTVANSLQNFYDRELEELTLYFNEELEDSEIRSYCERQDTVSYVALLDKEGKLKYSYGKDYDSYVEKELEEYLEYGRKEGKNSRARLLPAVLTEKNHYTQFLVSPAGITGMDGWAIAAIEMDYVYAKIVKPVQIGENGYSMVKQLDGTILMHPSQSQIGLDAVDGRKEVYKEYDLQYDDLQQWIQDQRENQEGSGLLNSYWWEDSGKPMKSTKVISYIQRQIGEEIWIINCTLNYEELLAPIRRAQNYVTLGTGLLLLVSAIVLGVSFQNAGNRKIMELEVSHLKEMNAAWEPARMGQTGVDPQYGALLHRHETSLAFSQKSRLILEHLFARCKHCGNINAARCGNVEGDALARVVAFPVRAPRENATTRRLRLRQPSRGPRESPRQRPRDPPHPRSTDA